MSDESDIQRVITTYSQYASRGDWDTVMTLYLPEAVWEIPHLGLKFDGKEQVAAALRGFKDAMAYVVQINGPALIEVTGDSAIASSAIRECGISADSNEGFEYLGLYVDTLARTPDGWKFRLRRFEGIGSHVFALTSGVVH